MTYKLLKETVYDKLQANLKETHEELVKSQSPMLTLVGIGDDEEPFKDSIIEYKQLKFDMSFEKPIESDFENAKMIYESLRITPNQAADNLFWSGIAFTEGHNYLKYRWGLENEKTIWYRWLMFSSQRRGLFYNGLSRLWWYTHLTIDENLDDKYMYTKMVFKNIEIMANMSYRNLSSSNNVVKGYLKYCYKRIENGIPLSKSNIQKILKSLSLLGGYTVIDLYNSEEIYDFLKSIYK